MSDFRKLGPAVVDADKVRLIRPANGPRPEIRIDYHDGNADHVLIESSANVEVTDDDLIKAAINEFYRPYNPPGAVFYEPIPAAGVSGYSGFSGVTDFTWETKK